MSGQIRLAHVVSHPIPYFAPVYRTLAARPEIELTVFFCSDLTLQRYYDVEFGEQVEWEAEMLSGYSWRLVGSAHGRPLKAVRRRPQIDLVRALIAGRFDAIWVHGYNHSGAWAAAVAARITRASLLLREEQTLIGKRSVVKRMLKRIMLGLFFRGTFGLYIGSQNRRFFEHYGIPEKRLFSAPYVVDNDELQACAEDLAQRRQEVRAQFGVDDEAPVIVFVGKLIEKKLPLLLLDAFERVRAEHRCWLLFVGDGRLGAEIDRLTQARSIPNVLRTGFLNQSMLHAAYAAADIFVLPSQSTETWGLVVNEALNFALPVIVSDAVGCAADLVEDGRSGFVVPVGEVSPLAERLKDLVLNADLRQRLGRRGRTIVEAYTIERCADGVVSACLAGTQK